MKKAQDNTKAGQALLFQSTYPIEKWLDRLNLSHHHRVLIERSLFGFGN
jgi:hypothetical protein